MLLKKLSELLDRTVPEAGFLGPDQAVPEADV